MNEFHFKECSPQNVVSIKKAMKQFRNNTSVVDNYNNLLKDTKTAISNIEQCINSKEELVQRHIRMKEGDVTFLDNVIGTNPRGNNDSHYRAYLALDEKNVVEIRVATHYTTKDTILDKSNNKSQFLLQVVLATPKPMSQEGELIDNTRNVGNLRVITQQRLSSQSSIEDLTNSLRKVQEFLINPNDSYEKSLLSQNQNNQENKNINCNRNMNKKLIRLTETDLHRIVKKSVNKVLREGVYNGTGHYFGSNGDGLEHMYAPTKEELFADIREHNWDELQRFVSDHRHLDDDNSPLVEAIEKAIELHNEAYTMIERIGEKLAYGDLTYNEH